MRLTSFVVVLVATGVVLSAQGRQGVQGPPDVGPLVFEIAARQYISADRMGSSAGDSGTDRIEGYAWTSAGLCGMSASTTEPATVPGVGWHFVGRVLSSDGGQMRVSVEWQRMWERGVRTPNGSSGSQTIALRNGERVQLDRVLPIGQSGCNVSEARLEAAVVARPVYRVGVMGAMNAMAMAGGRGGRASASGAGDATAPTAMTAVGAGASGVGAGGRASSGRGGGRGMGSASAADPTTNAATASVAAGRGRGTTAPAGPPVFERRFGRGSAASADPAVAGTSAAQAAAAGARGTSVGMGRGGRGGASSTNAADPANAATANASAAPATQAGGRGGRASTDFALGFQRLDPNNPDQRKAMNFTVFAKPTAREAELWLVHRTPDGTEHVQQQIVHFAGAEIPFVFPSVQVSTSKGTVTLEITGKLQSFVGDEAPARGASTFSLRPVNSNQPQPAQHILISLSRRARGNTPALLDSMGNSVMVIDVPEPNDTLSFEFPTLQKAAEDLLKGHLFSLRVKIK